MSPELALLKKDLSCLRWLMPIFLILGKLKLEDCHDFLASLNYRVRPYFKYHHRHYQTKQNRHK